MHRSRTILRSLAACAVLVLCWQVCALLAGGGYAEQVAVPEGQVLPVPRGLSVVEAAALPEVACTVWSTVFMASRLAKGEAFLVSNLPLNSGLDWEPWAYQSLRFT